MKVAVTHSVALNGGDAAILYALGDLLESAFGEVDVTVFDPDPEVACRLHPRFRFAPALHARLYRRRHRRLHAARILAAAGAPRLADPCEPSERATLEAYRDADLVVSTGGTYLVERFDLWPRRFDYALCERLERGVAFFTQTAGPFADPHNRQVIGAAFRRSPLLLFRDATSRDAALSLGASPTRTFVLPDAVFGLADTDRLAAATRPSPIARVAISVRGGLDFASPREGACHYEATLADLVARLLAEGRQVTFLSTCQGVPEYWTDDSATARRILRRLSDRDAARVRLDTRFRRPDELIARFADFDLVLATRLHAAILALVAGTPALPIAYERKTAACFASLPLPCPIPTVDQLGDLVASVKRFDTHLDRDALFAAVLEQREGARRAADLLTLARR
ncbi:MAG: polysaccharide pyruvyl transferase family protein [Polyangiaceae bacterium]